MSCLTFLKDHFLSPCLCCSFLARENILTRDYWQKECNN